MSIISTFVRPYVSRIGLIFTSTAISLVWGLRWLFVAIIAYKVAPTFGIEPLTFREAVLAVDGASSEIKIALGGALLTSAGFVTAFATAHYTWRSERLADLRLRAAEEIFDRSQEIRSQQLVMEVGLKRITRLIDASHSGSEVELSVALALALRELDELYIATKLLRRYGVEVHSLDAKYQAVASLHSGTAIALKEFATAASDLGTIAVVQLPPIGMPPDDFVQWCRRQKSDLYKDFLLRADGQAMQMIAGAGAFRGGMIAPIVRFGPAGILRAAGDIKRAREALRREAS